MGEPARGYSRPPFQPGNTAAVRHGAHSPGHVEQRANQLQSAATEILPWLKHPEHAAAVSAWSRAEARCLLVDEYLQEHGLLDDAGRVRPAAELVIKLERIASEARSRLGLDPTSRARLERDLSAGARDRIDVAKELAQGRELRLAAEARASAPGPANSETGPKK